MNAHPSSGRERPDTPRRTDTTRWRTLRHAPAIVFVLLCVTLTSGCQSRPPLAAYTRFDVGADTLDADTTTDRETPFARLSPAAYRHLQRELEPGDVIMGAKHSPTAALLRFSMDEYSYFTHSGIIDVRDGEVVVSHATGRFQFWTNSDRLLGKVVGSVEAVSLEEFIREYADIKIVRLPDAERNRRLAALTRACEDQRVPFDPFFDTSDPESVHCSEYTARALRTVGYRGCFDLARRTPNRSLSDLMAKLGVTTRDFIRVEGFANAPGTRTVAVISRFDRPEHGLAIAAALHVLHDEVTSDPTLRIGDVVGCSPERLMHYAPPAETYLRAVVGLAEASPTRDPVELRRRSRMLYDLVSRPYVESGLAGADPATGMTE